jgi:glycosyltransferase involved in cell wall biosynthesis
LVDRPWLKPRRLRRLIGAWQRQGGGVIYSNTATNGRLLAALPSGVGPVITHVHELEYGLQRFNRPRDLATTLARTDRFIAVSTAVKADLLARGVPTDRVTIVPNFLSSLPAPVAMAAARSEVCRRLGLAAATRIVLGCGHVDPLKGTDLFVAMITQLTSQGTPVIGVWLGGDIDRHYARRVRQMAGSQVKFVGEVNDPELYYAASDLVTITSRVESFSRVALEAGALGRPVLAFAEARGPADLLPAVALVPEMTGAAMAAAAARLLQDEAAAGLLGQELRSKIANGFLAKHWTEHLLRVTAEVKHA